MQITQNRLGYANNLKQNRTVFGRSLPAGSKIPAKVLTEAEKAQQAKVAHRVVNVLTGIASLACAGAVGLGAYMGNMLHRDLSRIPKAEMAISKQVGDFNAAHKIIDNAEAISYSLKGGSADAEKYLKQVKDSLAGKEVAPSKTFAKEIEEGAVRGKVIAKADSLKAEADSLYKSVNTCGCK